MKSDTGPFALVPEWVMEQVTPTELVVYCWLARYADAEGKAWPSRQTLADRMGMSVATVKRTVQSLIDKGCLASAPRFDKAGRQKSNEYVIRRVCAYELNPRGVTSDPGEGVTSDPQNENHKELEPLTGAGNPLTPFKDALADSCYGHRNLTQREWGRIQQAAKDLRDSGATPEEIHRRASEYRRRWPDVTLSPQALAGNWNKLVPVAVRDQFAPAPEWGTR